MKSYGQFCPVAKAAEIFAQRWTPLILRELCFGALGFNELKRAIPLVSRSVLAERLGELELAGIITASKQKGAGSEYRLTEAGEAFRPIIEMMSRWGQVWGQGKISSSDLDPDLLIWGMRRQVDRGRLPSGVFVIQFEFSGLPKAHQKRRYWWLVSRRPHLDVCLKNPGYAVDVTIAADLGSFTKVCMGHWGLREAGASIRIDGSKKAVALTRDLLGLHGEPTIKAFSYAEAPPRRTPVAGSRV